MQKLFPQIFSIFNVKKTSWNPHHRISKRCRIIHELKALKSEMVNREFQNHFPNWYCTDSIKFFSTPLYVNMLFWVWSSRTLLEIYNALHAQCTNILIVHCIALQESLKIWVTWFHHRCCWWTYPQPWWF